MLLVWLIPRNEQTKNLFPKFDFEELFPSPLYASYEYNYQVVVMGAMPTNCAVRIFPWIMMADILRRHLWYGSVAAENKKGFISVVDKNDGYSFLYPFGWQVCVSKFIFLVFVSVANVILSCSFCKLLDSLRNYDTLLLCLVWEWTGSNHWRSRQSI